MNPLDRLLQDEMNRLLDRVAAMVPEGVVIGTGRERPEVRGLIEALEARLSTLRVSLLEEYRQWRGAITEYEDLWALSALEAGVVEREAERRAA